MDPAQAVEMGQSICPLLADRSQNTADIASTVADRMGRPLGAATMFTGLAVSYFCPAPCRIWRMATRRSRWTC